MCVEALLRLVHDHNAHKAHVRKFAAECAALGVSHAPGLVFALLASNLEHDYLELLAVPECEGDNNEPPAHLAQPLSQSLCGALLGSSTW